MLPQISLINDTISKGDLTALSEWLLTIPRLTKGPLTEELERAFSDYIGVPHTVFVNSGSSALLLMLTALVEQGALDKDDKVAVSALSWSTDIASIIKSNLEPVLVDCCLKTLSIDMEALEETFKTTNISALLLVEVLGLVPNIKEIKDLCDKYSVLLLEDTCESLGSEFKQEKLGSFGRVSAFSTYYGHHISTVEGGLICTSDEPLADIIRSIRSHGWDRDLSKSAQHQLRTKYFINDFKALFTFYYPGFNLRSTDIQAFIGLRQLDKLDSIVKKRVKNFDLYNLLLETILEIPKSYGKTSNFAYPIISTKRDILAQELIKNNIETRPIIAGNMATQPYVLNSFKNKISYLPNATIIDEQGLYVPNHPDLSVDDIERVCTIVRNVLQN